MGIEIERKFLVRDASWQRDVTHRRLLRQGYLSRDGLASVRVRIDGNEAAYLSVKASLSGFSRHEFEYPIPIADGEQLLAFAVGAIVEKTRHVLLFDGRTWEIDAFVGDNAGLVLAEVELTSEHDDVRIPAWAGEEVTHDPRYYSALLAQHPFRTW